MFSIICGLIAFLLFTLNVTFWGILVILLTPFKALPFIKTLILIFAKSWIHVNVLIFKIFIRSDIQIFGLDKVDLSQNKSYLITSNHQSWIDIFFLQMIFLKRVPFLRFFLKQELIWVPILGLCWQALDFPFMKRYSKEEVAKDPSLAGKDLETTRRFCEKFKNIPISVVNFAEGTRFTKEKHLKKKSPYKKLLTPKAGGLGFVLGALGPYLDQILDVTIIYKGNKFSFLNFMLGKIETVSIYIKAIDINKELIGDYQKDLEYKQNMQNFLNEMWDQKDKLIQSHIF